MRSEEEIRRMIMRFEEEECFVDDDELLPSILIASLRWVLGEPDSEDKEREVMFDAREINAL
jgi:hypothetical protein